MSDEIFKGKKLSNVFQDIYENSNKKREQLDAMITKLSRMVMTAEDAEVLAPIIKDFMEVKVKNDEHIVRVAQIAQRALKDANKATGGDSTLSDEEKRQLLKNIGRDIEDLSTESQEIEDIVEDLKSNVQ